MKIIQTSIRNFKLLRNIDLEFSVDRKKPLTVIRAENGSGKTSTLQALCWGLYGKEVLEDKSIRLSPVDWPDNESCSISVEIDFIHTTVSEVNGNPMLDETKYRLKREVEENPIGNSPRRGNEKVQLYQLSDKGADLVEPVIPKLEQILPKEMIDIFFTDGDAAMAFISSHHSENAKKDKVRDAIRSLLGLDLFEKAKDRISKTKLDVTRKVSKKATSDELVSVSNEIENLTLKKEETEKNIKDKKDQIANNKTKLHRLERELTRSLEAGNLEHLNKQRLHFEQQLNEALEDEKLLKSEHQKLFNLELLSWELLEQNFRIGYDHLDKLHKKGVIPKASIPVLRERIEMKSCICGADLSEGTTAWKNVCSLLDHPSFNDNQLFDLLTTLYFHTQTKIYDWESEGVERWREYSTDITNKRIKIQNRIETANLELRSVKAKLKQINEDEINQKINQKDMLSAANIRLAEELSILDLTLKQIEREIKDNDKKYETLRQSEKKLEELNAEIAVLKDLEEIVESALKEMHEIYINLVSNKMNELFLQMVGAEPEQNAIFQKVEINEDYNIVVTSKDNRTLDTDFEVNGASKRALTFAFIWALTEISNVVAPRVIDTPLGMMSGSVKRRVIEMVSREALEDVDRQVILFLTQSEISHIEEVLDKQSGVTFTLIKTDDYPIDLINNPRTESTEIRICHCNHRQYCDQCHRKNYNVFDLEYREN